MKQLLAWAAEHPVLAVIFALCIVGLRVTYVRGER